MAKREHKETRPSAHEQSVARTMKDVDWEEALRRHRELVQKDMDDIARARAESLSASQYRWFN